MDDNIVIRAIEAITEWSGRLFSLLAIPLCLLVVYEVVRRAISSPSIWSFEVSLMFFGSHFMLLAGYGLKYKSHVSIDIISGRFSQKTQAVLSLFSFFVLFFPFVTVLFLYGSVFAYESWLIRETSWTMWGQPLYIVKTIIPVTSFLLLLQGVAEIIKLLSILKRG